MTYGFVTAADITPERAAQVRSWRTDDPDLSWRGVAAAASRAWGLPYGDNQLFGRELCRVSAQVLGEDPEAEPWI